MVEKTLGEFSNPEIQAFANVLSKSGSVETESKEKPDDPPQILYRVVFKQVDLWNRCGLNYQESANDTGDKVCCNFLLATFESAMWPLFWKKQKKNGGWGEGGGSS